MTDERQGDALWTALERLPRGAGVIVRHRSLERGERKALIARIGRIARRKRLLLVVGGTAREAAAARAGGVHGRKAARVTRPLVHTAPIHSVRELVAAERAGADLLFLSPVFATRSHADARPLSRVRFGLIARQTRTPVIALGGMTPERAKSLCALKIHGWAAIDAWSVRT